MIHPASGANECAIAPVGSAMELRSGLTRDEARRQMWADAVGNRRVLQGNPTENSRDPSGRTWTVDTAAIEEGGGVYVVALVLEYDDGRVNQVSVVATDREQPMRSAILNGYPVEPKPY